MAVLASQTTADSYCTWTTVSSILKCLVQSNDTLRRSSKAQEPVKRLITVIAHKLRFHKACVRATASTGRQCVRLLAHLWRWVR